jgi:hypothetical protein
VKTSHFLRENNGKENGQKFYFDCCYAVFPVTTVTSKKKVIIDLRQSTNGRKRKI